MCLTVGLADIVPPNKRAAYQGYMGAGFGVASVLGVFTSHLCRSSFHALTPFRSIVRWNLDSEVVMASLSLPLCPWYNR